MRTLALVATVAGLGIAAAGCGGSGAPAVANLGTTAAASPTTSVPGSSATAGGSGAATSGGGSGGKTGAPFSVAGSVQQLTRFAACMRRNGEPSFPDPNAQGVLSAGSLDRGSPQFERALQACRKEMPGGTPSPAQRAQELRQAVASSACMRRNGVLDFPDPQTGPGGGLVIHPGANVDPTSPQFERAQKICQNKVPGGKG